MSGWGIKNNRSTWAKQKFTYVNPKQSNPINNTNNHNQISCVKYYSNFLSNPTELFTKFLKEFNFEERIVESPDSEYKLNRATCIFGDADIIDEPPKIWGNNNPIVPWTPELLKIKNKIQELTGKHYNICLCNYYKNGKKTINWHSDNEEKGSISSIASISLGAERLFQFRDKQTGNIYDYILENGSLILMMDGCQENYMHRIPSDHKIKEGRINLTFRLFDKMRYSNR